MTDQPTPLRGVQAKGETVEAAGDAVVRHYHPASENHHPRAEVVARAFHEAYERLAPAHDYGTRAASAVPWDQVPEPNRSLMVHVADELLKRGVIS